MLFIKNKVPTRKYLSTKHFNNRKTIQFSLPPDREDINFLIKCGISFSTSILLVSQLINKQEHTLENIYTDIRPSVVTIKTSGIKQDPFDYTSIIEYPLASGSGFIMFDNEHVVTNTHVIEGASSIYINDKEAIPEVVDIKNDITILKLSQPTPNQALKACTNNINIGRRVVAIGNPFNLEGSMTEGIISGKDRYMYDPSVGININNLLQTDASINPGNSGGPLIDVENECVIGMNTSIISPSGASAGIGLAIPIDKIIDVFNVEHANIQNNGDTISLGLILTSDIYNDILGIKGVIVSGVVDGGIADKLGIQGTQRDNVGRPIIGDIITKINDKIVRHSEDILNEVSKAKHGDVITMEVIKNDTKETLSIMV